ncbi:polysaccharide pyruvyl transferase family protein [Aquimarina algicola]|uniref:Polysaccharide pyruvyl transferase family protein n=1 Tax=Aquimarina algicola TaxID=2589995 RepID=A0A504JN64_9FLAO|nr:polysaccharide pyruvyl transferase family protein [Aquimarina algicola]TPN89143.1 polysaccharide pyruvyl transferase family protein [Aquimarina algicola]
MNKLMMYPHGGSYNHGCEAIVKTTLDIMEKAIPDISKEKILFSMRPNEDIQFDVHEECKVFPQTKPLDSKFSANYISGMFKLKVLGDKDVFDRIAHREIFDRADKNTLALSIGGDNYCYGRPGDIYYINSYVRKNGSKTVLWGCSIEPSAMDDEMVEDLKQYEFIFARETITYNALLEKGVEKARLCPDPAFLLEKEEVELPQGFEEGNTIGINLSPMIMSYEKNEGAAFDNYKALIEYLIAETKYQIALIPHVMWDHNDDRIPLKKLYENFKDTNRVIFVAEDNKFNCSQLKYIISKCNIFIAARTHSSIAAYSQCVPTLVVGYSVKAIGIARDLFGTEEGYVFPVQSLNEREDLIEQFKNFAAKEEKVRAYLVSMMPEYKSRIIEAAKEINTLQ